MPAKHKPIPPAIVNWISYDPETGIFTWRRSSGPKSQVGSIAGTIRKGRLYVTIMFAGKIYLAHRVAWYLHYKQDPNELEIDHDDNDPSNNKITNLRPATHQQNCCNRIISSANTSGVKGVSWDKSMNKWRAEIIQNNKRVWSNVFDTIEQAEAAIKLKRTELHKEFTNHG